MEQLKLDLISTDIPAYYSTDKGVLFIETEKGKGVNYYKDIFNKYKDSINDGTQVGIFRINNTTDVYYLHGWYNYEDAIKLYNIKKKPLIAISIYTNEVSKFINHAEGIDIAIFDFKLQNKISTL